MVNREHKTELVWFLSIIEETEVIINSMEDDFWETEYERTGSLTDGVGSKDWIYI